MPGANCGSGKHRPSSIIPDFGQVPENASKSARGKQRGIFHECVPGSKLAKDSSKLKPQSRARAINAKPFSGGADVLAGEAAGDNKFGGVGAEPVEGVAAVGIVGAEGSHIVPDCEVGEAQGEDALAEGIDFNGADGFDAEEEVGEESAAGAGEEVKRVLWEIHGMVIDV